jgi:hypothetical protein
VNLAVTIARMIAPATPLATGGQRHVASLRTRTVRCAVAPYLFTKAARCTSKIRAGARTRMTRGTILTIERSLAPLGGKLRYSS